MHQVNVRGTFITSKHCIPHLKKSKHGGRILNNSPPLVMNPRWFAPNLAYTMTKYGMSMCVLGMAEEVSLRSRLCSYQPYLTADEPQNKRKPVALTVGFLHILVESSQRRSECPMAENMDSYSGHGNACRRGRVSQTELEETLNRGRCGLCHTVEAE